MDTPENKTLDALAERVLEARVEFETRLPERGKRFPVEEFDRLWLAVLEYATQMKKRKWLHRDVVREFSGFREYLQLEIFNTPGHALRRADRMEILLFNDYDAYPEDDDLPVPESTLGETELEFGLHEGECAGCEVFRRIGDLGLCEDCSGMLERDLIRKRDWASSVTVYGLSDHEREDVRSQIVHKFGEGQELIDPIRPAKLERKRRKGKRQK